LIGAGVGLVTLADGGGEEPAGRRGG
jgi:hypothetical protein